ncbi:MAG: serine hydrolase [Clostridiales bacterium]|uniref:serine hydrolase n=1 Tax=Clostridium sp. N3C TaxID=1776758 RepID=UPI00092E0DB8|nr:serine hydrolase [Clostridium sp. N3C]NLZ47920.1 serine hydrolase [Clostridiales bacterium]SCN26393.1 Beta-lactamase 3 precursor [Clostridium sp. N3C]
MKKSNGWLINLLLVATILFTTTAFFLDIYSIIKIIDRQNKYLSVVKDKSSEASDSVNVVQINNVESIEEKIRLQKWKEELEQQIKDFWGEELPKVGLVYYDLERDQKIAINEDKVFLAASTSKVQINMITYELAKNGDLSLEEGILYLEEDFAEGAGRILADYKKTEPIPIQVLLDYSIKYSDNIATNMIIRRLGGSVNLRKLANIMAATNTDTEENFVTPEQQFRLLKLLYDKRKDKYYSHLLKLMKNTDFHDRLDKYIPKKIVAHKVGDYSTYVHDVGIIFTEKPYILVVYTNNLPELIYKQPHERIAKLSKLIYEAHLKK